MIGQRTDGGVPSRSPLTERAEAAQAVWAARDGAGRRPAGQVMTPAPVARFMAGLFPSPFPEQIRLLDPGAGAGMLFAAFVDRVLEQERLPRRLRVDAVESDPCFSDARRVVFNAVARHCQGRGVAFDPRDVTGDFLGAGVAAALGAAYPDPGGGEGHTPGDAAPLEVPRPGYTHCIVNPPYRKIRRDSPERKQLERLGLAASNAYAGFLAVASRLLEPGGSLVAIVPRSFANGPYFRPFRRMFLAEMRIVRAHLFRTRDRAFKEAGVLQENVIVHAQRGGPRARVVITSSVGPEFGEVSRISVPHAEIVSDCDPDLVIHLPLDEEDRRLCRAMSDAGVRLEDLGVRVSTGQVVEFRLKPALRAMPGPGTCPLIGPGHLDDGRVSWPDRGGRRPNAIAVSDSSRRYLVPRGWYVVVKRFTSPEEPRRIVAAVLDPSSVPGRFVGFENHLNVFHRNGAGLDPKLARGLAAYLNSRVVDRYFRVWSGHTQVNVADLVRLPYPDVGTLLALGRGQVSRHLASARRDPVDGLAGNR